MVFLASCLPLILQWGENQGETWFPLGVPFLCSLCLAGRETDRMITLDARLPCPLKDPPSGISCLTELWGQLDTSPETYLAWGIERPEKPSHGGQLLSELGSKSPSVLQKNIFQTESLSPWFEWMLNESLGIAVALLRNKLSEVLCDESSPPVKVLFVWAFAFTASEAHQKLIRKLSNWEMWWLIFLILLI